MELHTCSGSFTTSTLASQASFNSTKGHRMSKSTKAGSPPVHKIRHGAVSASIWRQETRTGPMFNVTFQCAYKDGDTWKHSASFGQRNLLVVGLLAARAFEWIATQPRGIKPPGQAPQPGDDVPF